MKTISTTDFIEHANDVLAAVVSSGEDMLVTDAGKVVARITPEHGASKRVPHGALFGTVVENGDIVAPLENEWDAMK
ncbi:MAG TPA: hypothetical protein VFN10_10450 [Thermoanaerobaculia bacterium]|nr:hypothetical protein [Thermoanaerobaculia bacterium]